MANSMKNSGFGVLDNRFLSRSIGFLDPRSPVTMNEDESISAALKLLRENRVGSLVVVNEQGKLSGIFTERDVILKLTVCDIAHDSTAISAVMTPNPHREQMTTTIAYALNLMSQGGYRHIPIVDEQDFPVGIISVKDIVDYIVSQLNRDLTDFRVSAN